MRMRPCMSSPFIERDQPNAGGAPADNRRMRVGLYDDPLFREHDSGPGHPERPQRLEALREGIGRAGLEPRLEAIAPRDATREELLRVHTPAHVSTVAATAGRTVRF